MLSKMTCKEKLKYLKKRNAPSEEEIRRAEMRKQHGMKLEEWSRYVENLPKTWRGYVENVRAEKSLFDRQESFPDIPNPMPNDYPMPKGWDESKISAEYPREDAQD